VLAPAGPPLAVADGGPEAVCSGTYVSESTLGVVVSAMGHALYRPRQSGNSRDSGFALHSLFQALAVSLTNAS
jgi:hypothetical protein